MPDRHNINQGSSRAELASAILSLASFTIIILAILSILAIPALPSASAGWPDCKFQCTAGDVTLLKAYLGDANGNPLGSRNEDSPTRAYLWITIYNNANSERRALVLLADVYINGVLQYTTYPQGTCILDSIPGKEASTYAIYSIPWSPGQPVKLSRAILSWETTQGTTCGNADLKCSNRNTKCYGGTATDIPVDVPPTANFNSTSLQCSILGPNPACLNSASNYTAEGREVPSYAYSYSWALDGDLLGHGKIFQVIWKPKGTGNHTLQLSVTSSANGIAISKCSSSISVKVLPEPPASIAVVRVE